MHENVDDIDRDLLLALAQGDHLAYQEVFNRYWGLVYGTALRLTKSPEIARDLAQDIFLKVWENRDRLPGVRNFRSFLFTVSHNLIIDYLRKKVLGGVNLEELVQFLAEESMPNPDTHLEGREQDRLLQLAVSRLSPQLQQVYALRAQGMNHEKIARQLNISHISSKKYIVRALAEIRKVLSGYS